METLRDTPTTLMFHAEMLPPLADSVGDAVQSSEPPLAPHGDLDSYQTFLESRPPAFETYAIDQIVSLSKLAPGLHLHIVHLSATQAIPILRRARDSGVNITAETCFHYLGLAAEDVATGDTRHKCCPPIREESNRAALWDELAKPDSCIQTVVSDHSPCTPELKLLPPHIAGAHAHALTMHHADSGIDVTLPLDDADIDVRKLAKREAARAAATDSASSPGTLTPPTQAISTGDFFAAWGGVSSVGLGLPVLYTAAKLRASLSPAGPNITIVDIIRLCSQATAKQVGLSHCKGGLAVGLDGDVCVFDDSESAMWRFGGSDMRWKNRCSPWEGREFAGRVTETWLRGRKVFELGGLNDGFVGKAPVGRAIVEKRIV